MMSGMLVGSIIATIISTQPRMKSAQPRGASGTVAAARGRGSGRTARPHSHSASQATADERDERPEQDRPVATAAARRWAATNIVQPSGRAASGGEAEVALEGVVALEVLHARDAVAAAVARVLARLGRVHRRAGIVLNTVSERVVGLPVAPTYGAISASTSSPSVRRPLPPSTVKPIGTRSTADDLADEPGQVGDRATELSGEQLDERRPAARRSTDRR